MAVPYEVEVEMDVDPDLAWRAVSDPDEIQYWFGWEAPSLPGEIQFIFVDNARIDADSRRIEFEDSGGHYLEVESAGEGTIVRAVQPGDESPAGYSSIREGWLAFFFQLRRYLERRPSGRRTLYLSGTGPADEMLGAVDERLGGESWFAGDHTNVIVKEGSWHDMAVLSTVQPVGSSEMDTVSLTVTTFDLSEEEFEHEAAEWMQWWRSVADGAELVTARA